jgi:hypothetical protein
MVRLRFLLLLLLPGDIVVDAGLDGSSSIVMEVNSSNFG